MPARTHRNTVTHAAGVVAALHAMQSGEAANKTEAAQKAGIHPGSLQPGALARVSRNPLMRSLVKTDPLDITAEIEGKRVSMREALSKGAESAVRTLGTLAPRLGTLNKAETEQVRQCKMWLDLARNMGLFREMDAPTLPGELSGLINGDEEHGPDEGSVEWYLLHGNTHAQPPGLLTVVPSTNPIPSQPEDVAKDGKEGDKPCQPRAQGDQ